jgi:hypothetical protein
MVPTFPAHQEGNSETTVNNEKVRLAQRKLSNVQRQIRYAPELKQLKSAYEYKCQVNSSHDVLGRHGSKVVVHHLYPVGEDGPLVTQHHSNEIVICPNCHALFDDGSLWIDWWDGATLHHWSKSVDFEGKTITLNMGHILDRALLEKAYALHWSSNKIQKKQ